MQKFTFIRLKNHFFKPLFYPRKFKKHQNKAGTIHIKINDVNSISIVDCIANNKDCG